MNNLPVLIELREDDYYKNEKEHIKYRFTIEYFNYLKNVPIWLDVPRAFYLFKQIKIRKPSRVLEIGSAYGGSLLCMFLATNLDPGIEFVCADDYTQNIQYEDLYNKKCISYAEKRYNRIKEIVKRFDINCKIIRQDSKKCLHNLGRFDFFFIDGQHSKEHVLHDFYSCFKMSKENSLIVGDNYKDYFKGVDEAVHKLIDEGYDIKFPKEAPHFWTYTVP